MIDFRKSISNRPVKPTPGASARTGDVAARLFRVVGLHRKARHRNGYYRHHSLTAMPFHVPGRRRAWRHAGRLDALLDHPKRGTPIHILARRSGGCGLRPCLRAESFTRGRDGSRRTFRRIPRRLATRFGSSRFGTETSRARASMDADSLLQPFGQAPVRVVCGDFVDACVNEGGSSQQCRRHHRKPNPASSWQRSHIPGFSQENQAQAQPELHVVDATADTARPV